MPTLPCPPGLLLLVLLLAGCRTAGPAPVPQGAAPVAPGTTEPLRFAELAIGSMRRGMEIGRYVWGIDCGPPYERVHWTSGQNMRRGSTFEERFDEVLSGAGFDMVGRIGGPDAPESGNRRAVFTIQGDLKDVRLELCHRSHWLTGADKGVSGTGSLRVDWAVYDARSGRLVHRLTTSGTAERDSGVPQGDIALMEDAFAAAADRLAADPGFRAAVARGGPAPVAKPVDAAPNDVRLPAAAAGAARAVDARQWALQPPSLSPDPAGRAGHAQVRVGEGRESGIGLVIGTADGQSLLLTLAAGAASTLAVSPAAGVTLAGTVEARDPASGLALVRVPARLTGLAVRPGPARVGEPVTALTRGGEAETPGIIGSLREDPRSGTLLIQADLDTAPAEAMQAEAGEPLLDRDGLLLGLAAPGRDRSARGVPGLVPYLPVAEALRRMEVTVFAADPLPRTARTSSGTAPLRRHTAPAYPDDES